MIAVSRNYIIISLAALPQIVFSSQAIAACSRDDVTFYLDKGFSTDQITAMCGASAPAVKTQQSEAQNNEQHFVSPEVDDSAMFLQRAIKGKKISLGSDALRYTQKVCIEYGEEDLFGFAPKVCPDVTYTIARKGLEVLDTGKKYGFYGTLEVRVESTIQREIIGGLKDQNPEDREMIMEVFEKGDKTAIPIRDDFSLEQAKQVLEELSK